VNFALKNKENSEEVIKNIITFAQYFTCDIINKIK
jgi:hypothetical protein